MYKEINSAMYEYQLARAKLIKLHMQQEPNLDISKLAHYLSITPETMKAIIKCTIDGTYPVKPK